MRTATATEFHDHVTEMINSKEPIVVTRRGHTPVGIFYPMNSRNIPKEVRLQALRALTEGIRKEMKLKGISAAEILKEFEETGK